MNNTNSLYSCLLLFVFIYIKVTFVLGGTVYLLLLIDSVVSRYLPILYVHTADDGCPFKSSSKSFLFTLYNTHGYRPQILHLRSSYHYQHALRMCKGHGPVFGGGSDLRIADNANAGYRSWTYSGYSYQAPHGCSNGGSKCSVLAGSFTFRVSDIEIFYKTS